MREYTQKQAELINAVDDLLAKRREVTKAELRKDAAELRKDEAVKKVEDLLQKRIGRNV